MVDMGTGMVVVITNSMDLVTMVITKRLLLLWSEALKIFQEKVVLQSVFGT
jgi:hypothetical protein